MKYTYSSNECDDNNKTSENKNVKSLTIPSFPK